MLPYPRVVNPTPGDRILIVAPHIDDEMIGAGGYAVDAIANGAEVFVVFLTAGDCNRFTARILHRTLDPTASNYLSVGRTRIAEAKEAMKRLGLTEKQFFILGYPDRGLRPLLDDRTAVVRSSGTERQDVPYEDALSPGSPYRFESLLSDLSRVVSIARPTTVIAPVAFDRHPDHSAAAELTDLTLAHAGVNPHRLGYLVHFGRIATAIVPMRDRALTPPPSVRALRWASYPLTREAQKQKDAILQVYKSQQPYMSLLRNAFIRPNELFFVHGTESAAVVPPRSATAAARIPIAR